MGKITIADPDSEQYRWLKEKGAEYCNLDESTQPIHFAKAQTEVFLELFSAERAKEDSNYNLTDDRKVSPRFKFFLASPTTEASPATVELFPKFQTEVHGRTPQERTSRS